MRRNKTKQFGRQVAVRIDYTNAFTGFNVLNYQIAKQCRFAGAGFSNEVQMVTPIGA